MAYFFSSRIFFSKKAWGRGQNIYMLPVNGIFTSVLGFFSSKNMREVTKYLYFACKSRDDKFVWPLTVLRKLFVRYFEDSVSISDAAEIAGRERARQATNFGGLVQNIGWKWLVPLFHIQKKLEKCTFEVRNLRNPFYGNLYGRKKGFWDCASPYVKVIMGQIWQIIFTVQA